MTSPIQAKATPSPTPKQAIPKRKLDTNQTWYTINRADASFDSLKRTEWLLTDGLGGYAMGTALGINTRRYHGLLVHANRQPLGRIMMLNSLAERIIINPNTHEQFAVDLTLHEFSDGSIAPGSYDHFVRFEKGAEFVRWTWRVADIEITRELRLHFKKGGAFIRYQITQHPDDHRTTALEIRPLLRLADHHRLRHAESYQLSVEPSDNGFIVTGSSGELHVLTPPSEFKQDRQIWFNFRYAEETARGVDDTEDLYNPGYVQLPVEHNRDDQPHTKSTAIRIGASPQQITQPFGWDAKTKHLQNIAKNANKQIPKLIKNHLPLIAAADDFLVPRHVKGHPLQTILAGYPWFSDWGRDTCIALPGLLLSLARYDEALATLRAFADHRKDGLIPNMFDDNGGAAHFNTVDASLWFCHAATQYRKLTNDHAGFQSHLQEACLDILGNYQHGTDFNIHMDDDDGLIIAGDPSTQLTWMDAKRDEVTFTPRHGKAVEINALWYHALLAVAHAINDHDPTDAKRLNDLAQYVGPNLRETFWCSATKCLYDCIYEELDSQAKKTTWIKDRSIRPNQLLAVSLPHSAFNPKQQKSIVKICTDHLLTPVGIRTLSPDDEKYRGWFEGRMFDRDGAYHQGTVWPWLIGPYLEALLRSNQASKASIRKTKSILKRLLRKFPATAAGQVAYRYMLEKGWITIVTPNAPVTETETDNPIQESDQPDSQPTPADENPDNQSDQS